MDSNQHPIQPEILPPQETPEIYASDPVPPSSQAPTPRASSGTMIKKYIPFIAIFLILIIALVAVKSISPPAETETITETITPTPTITTQQLSTKKLSPFASESAFMVFDTAIEQLPKTIQGAVLQDSTAFPPVLDLELGFSN